MEIFNVFAEHGILGLVLGFILFIIIKPVVSSYVKLIDKNTEVLASILNKVDQNLSHSEEIKGDIKEIKSDIKQINNKL
ncbi:MAG: hypothetical protein IPO86_09935 [Saprospiraceae bacterium]|nr:hypothetical protein [Saprospiraceae bacterium]MBK9728425.1 hypothetical protein [Saprospiraceae bacterium]